VSIANDSGFGPRKDAGSCPDFQSGSHVRNASGFGDILKATPHAEEKISYQIPTFKLKGKNLIHFAAYKKHIGFYPTPSGITAFKAELESYECAKGSVKFPLDKPLPLELILRMVKFRVEEILGNER
jgi:uncharacterized protein YdhG (YjbR/CyaY superfamily)